MGPRTVTDPARPAPAPPKPSRPWIGLRGRVALAVAIVGLLATTTVGILAYQATAARLSQDTDESLQQAAGVLLARPSRGPGAALGGPRVLVPQRLPGFDEYAVQLVATDGEVVNASSGVDLPVSTADLALAGRQEGAVIATGTDPAGERWRILTVGVPGGAVQIARSLASTDAVLDDLGRRIGVLVILVTLGGAALGWLLAYGVTQRIRRLTTAADQVGTSGDLGVPVPTEGNDEAGRLGRAFDRKLASLDESRRRQQQLVEDAGHELRTPLTSLRTNLDVLRRHPDLDAGMRAQVLDDLDRDTTELATLVEEVVAVAADRYDDGPPTRVPFGPIVERAAARLGRRTGRQLLVTTDDSVVVARPAALERAVANLLDNAAKFSPAETPIEVHVAHGTLTVADRGPGIPPGDLERIFDRFHRTPEARSLPGSGLGLAIVATVAADSGGRATARNRQGGGAEFLLELPPTTTATLT